MAAAQPFLSGAISKTVNHAAGHDGRGDRKDLHRAWKMGLKAIAIYRDGCTAQPAFSTGKDEDAIVATAMARSRRPRRRKLPDTRQSVTHKFSVAGFDGYITWVCSKTASPARSHHVGKAGSTLAGFADAFATAISSRCSTGSIYGSSWTSSRTCASSRPGSPEIRRSRSRSRSSTTSSVGWRSSSSPKTINL